MMVINTSTPMIMVMMIMLHLHLYHSISSLSMETVLHRWISPTLVLQLHLRWISLMMVLNVKDGGVTFLFKSASLGISRNPSITISTATTVLTIQITAGGDIRTASITISTAILITASPLK
jgi:hypothetical protein